VGELASEAVPSEHLIAARGLTAGGGDLCPRYGRWGRREDDAPPGPRLYEAHRGGPTAWQDRAAISSSACRLAEEQILRLRQPICLFVSVAEMALDMSPTTEQKPLNRGRGSRCRLPDGQFPTRSVDNPLEECPGAAPSA
jgi:hypothetical protein